MLCLRNSLIRPASCQPDRLVLRGGNINPASYTLYRQKICINRVMTFAQADNLKMNCFHQDTENTLKHSMPSWTDCGLHIFVVITKA